MPLLWKGVYNTMKYKFRAYNKETKTMILLDPLQWPLHALNDEGNWKVMIWTGLCDRFDKEIYEGDIVKFETLDVINNQTLTGIIKYSEHGTKFGVEIEHRGLLQFYPNCTEVIGNIYESP